MKSLNFKRKENSQLRYIEEQITGKRKSHFNWDRIVYLSILGLIIFFVLRYFFIHNFYISANGQVIFDSIEISETEDVRIEKYFFDEGENITVGDTLFSYLVEDPNIGGGHIVDNSGDKSNWAEREMYSLKKSMELNNSQIRGDRELMASYQSQLDRLENEVILGAASEKDLNNLEYQISKLKTSISLTQSENGVLGKQLRALQQNEISLEEYQAGNPMAEFTPYRVYVSPIDGYVARIFKDPFEVAMKSEVIMKIHQSDSVHVKGYFEQEDLKYVSEGDLVSIGFPDGKESEGVIERFYSSTVIIPEEFQKKFEPAKRTIAVDIKPAPGSDLDVWKRYYKLSVKLTKRTF